MLRDPPDSLGTHLAHSSIEFLPVLPMDVLVSVTSAARQDVAKGMLVPPSVPPGTQECPHSITVALHQFPPPPTDIASPFPAAYLALSTNVLTAARRSCFLPFKFSMMLRPRMQDTVHNISAASLASVLERAQSDLEERWGVMHAGLHSLQMLSFYPWPCRCIKRWRCTSNPPYALAMCPTGR